MLGKSAAYLNFNSGINKFFYYFFHLVLIQTKLFFPNKKIEPLETPIFKGKYKQLYFINKSL